MPTLRQVTCSLELGPRGAKLKEYGHRYTDGGVEALVAVSRCDIPFHVHVTSNGYIAPGLAAYVFMDGQYQCNRNRQQLRMPTPGMSPQEYQIDFRLRQKEEKAVDGLFIARDWTFAQLRTDVDGAPDSDPNYAQNVGSIEVIILRCKDGPALAPLQNATAPPDVLLPREPKATSVHKSAAGDDTKASVRAAPQKTLKSPSKGGSEEPPKPTEKPASAAKTKASTRKPQEAGEDAFGGMLGIFDGAGDYADYEPQWDPRRAGVWHDELPARRSTYSGRPRRQYDHEDDRHHHDARASRHQHAAPFGSPSEMVESSCGPIDDRYRPRQHGGLKTPYESPLRQQVPRPRDMRSDAGYSRRPVQHAVPARNHLPEGFALIQGLCNEIEATCKSGGLAKQKAEELHYEAQMYRDDPEMHLAAMKALRNREQEIGKLDDECQALFETILARMRRMDGSAWRYARDYLVEQKGIVPADHPEMQQRRDARLPRYPRPASSPQLTQGQHLNTPQNDGWQQVGEGERDGRPKLTLAERKAEEAERQKRWMMEAEREKQRDQDAAQGLANTGRPDRDAADTYDAANDAKPARSDNDWAHPGGGDNKPGDGWADQQDKAWGDDNKAEDDWNDQPKDNNEADQGWAARSASRKSHHTGSRRTRNDDFGRSQQNADWAGDDAKADGTGSGWGNTKPEDNKSRSHQSKVNNWQDAGDKPKSASGWGNTAKTQIKPQNDGAGWEAQSKKPSVAHRSACEDATSSAVLKPVIKTYWNDWNKPTSTASGKHRERARDAYEYPALPTPGKPTSKSESVDFGVQAGRGANYAHRTYQPDYLDSMEIPYAIFTFKYRSKAALEKILNRKIDTSAQDRTIEELEKEQLSKLPKEELVQRMMKMKPAPSQHGKAASKAASKAAAQHAWAAKPSYKVASNNHWGDQANDEVKPSDSVSNVPSRRSGWIRTSAKENERGWNDYVSQEKSASRKSQGKDAKQDAWDAGGNDAWAADNNNDQWGAADQNAGKNGGGDDAWADDKKTEEHFAGDANLQRIGDPGW